MRVNETNLLASQRSLNESNPYAKNAEKNIDPPKKPNYDLFEFAGEENLNNVYSPKSGYSVSGTNSIYDESNYYSTTKPLSQMIANRAKYYSEGATNGAVYSAELGLATIYLNQFTPINPYICSSPNYEYNPVYCEPVTRTNLTQDHQYFLYALTGNYDTTKKNYYKNQGYTIDAYMLMGIDFGESGASKTSGNPFGASDPLGASSVSKATSRAIEALQSCGLAGSESEARSLMNGDPFYQKAAEVLSYLDNGYKDGHHLSTVYGTANQAQRNAERWRNAVANNSQDKRDFAFYYYK